MHVGRAGVAVHIRSAAGEAHDHPVRRGERRRLAPARVFPIVHLSRPHEPGGHGGRQRHGDLPHRRTVLPEGYTPGAVRHDRVRQPGHHSVPVRGAQVPLVRGEHAGQMRQDHPGDVLGPAHTEQAVQRRGLRLRVRRHRGVLHIRAGPRDARGQGPVAPVAVGRKRQRYYFGDWSRNGRRPGLALARAPRVTASRLRRDERPRGRDARRDGPWRIRRWGRPAGSSRGGSV